MVVVMSVLRGEALWTSRSTTGGRLRWLTGRGAGFALILVMAGSATAYYAVFGGILMAFAGFVAFVRGRSWCRLGGVVAAEILLVVVFFANLLPDLLYARDNGPNSAALVRGSDGAEVWVFKLTSLLLPAPGHPIRAWADFRQTYDATHPFPSEKPALGLICAVTLVAVLIIALIRIGHRVERSGDAETLARRRAGGRPQHDDRDGLPARDGRRPGRGGGLRDRCDPRLEPDVRLYVTASARRRRPAGGGWHREMAIPAGWSSSWLEESAHRPGRGRPSSRRRDGRSAGRRSVPPYSRSAAMWNSDEAFVRQIEGAVPAGSCSSCPTCRSLRRVRERGRRRRPAEAVLHSTSLRWSLGGIRGGRSRTGRGLWRNVPPTRSSTSSRAWASQPSSSTARRPLTTARSSKHGTRHTPGHRRSAVPMGGGSTSRWLDSWLMWTSGRPRSAGCTRHGFSQARSSEGAKAAPAQ